MTRRRNSGVLDTLIDFPWWVSVIVAAAVYILVRWVLPGVVPNNPVLIPLIKGLSGNAGLLASFFLLPAAFSFLRQIQRGKTLESQRDLTTLRQLSWREFEGLVGEAFRRQGYFLIEQGGNQPDGGIDLILRKNGQLVLVQCKHWQSRQVGVQVIREQFGILTAQNASKVVVVTSGSFTEESKAFAAGKPIELVDGPKLLDLVGQVQQRRDRAPSTGIAAVEQQNTPVACPKCGSEMRRRSAKQGSHVGQEFWGCVRFPACRGTRPV